MKERSKKPMEKKVYKVVHHSCGRYYSCSFIPALDTLNFLDQRGLILEYSINKKTSPLYGKIFVFNTKKNAIDYINLNFSGPVLKYYKIMEGIGENPKKLKYMCSNPNQDKIFWEQLENGQKIEVQSAKNPPGTLSVDSFIPEKILE